MRTASRTPNLILLAAFVLMLSAAPSATSARENGKPRHAQGEALLCRFLGRFIKVSLPDAPIQAIPLDLIDANFVVAVQVDAIREGHLPDGWREQIAFVIHSPALFFGGQGIEPPAYGEAPPGKFVFSLWQHPNDRRFALDVEPASGEPAAVSPEVFGAVAERPVVVSPALCPARASSL